MSQNSEEPAEQDAPAQQEERTDASGRILQPWEVSPEEQEQPSATVAETRDDGQDNPGPQPGERPTHRGAPEAPASPEAHSF